MCKKLNTGFVPVVISTIVDSPIEGRVPRGCKGCELLKWSQYEAGTIPPLSFMVFNRNV